MKSIAEPNYRIMTTFHDIYFNSVLPVSFPTSILLISLFKLQPSAIKWYFQLHTWHIIAEVYVKC